MLDLQTQRKTKIVLSDYDYRRDIENRLLMSGFTNRDFLVLQEVIYSPIRFSVRKMASELELSENTLKEILKNLGKTGLLSINGDAVEVDKEMRKYFEIQALKFEDDFKPGVEYQLSLLRKVPIHVLPAWYAVPRTSNNIIESIIERYLQTPQVYYRYLQDFYLYYPTLAPLIKDLFSSSNLKLTGQHIIERYRMTREQFEESMLLLEFSFIACLRYECVNDVWQEIVTPFEEWEEYLLFLRNTQASPILEEEEIERVRPNDFSFVLDMVEIVKTAKIKPIPLKDDEKGNFSPGNKTIAASFAKKLAIDFDTNEGQAYFSRLITKLRLIKLAEIRDGELYPNDFATTWSEFDDAEKAMYLYRQPLNRIISPELPERAIIDKSVRESEKSIQRVLHAGWVPFEEFLSGVLIAFGDEPAIILKKTGRSWKYARPEYTKEQTQLIRATILDWLFETGVVATGKYQGNLCFKVTDFGHSLFGR